jgi:hypothetical protein
LFASFVYFVSCCEFLVVAGFVFRCICFSGYSIVSSLLPASHHQKEHILNVFGGAGPQHACAMARSLGIERVVVNRFSSVLSAFGLGLADEKEERVV